MTEPLIVLHSELLELSLLQVEHCLVQATFIHGANISTRVHQLQAFVEEILNENFLIFDKKDCLSVTRMADMAATMAGVPKPWLIMEKWVKCLWMAGSMIGVGLVLHSGERSWFRKSTSSLQMNLKYPCSVKLVSVEADVTWWPPGDLSTGTCRCAAW